MENMQQDKKIPYSLAEDIQLKVNFQITYKKDQEQFNKPDFWVIPENFGDCEDYVLLKRDLLSKEGYLSCCHIAICWTETSEYHAVLIVETDKGMFVLDNRHKYPKMKQELNYRWERWEREGFWYTVS